jgi:hypothetical protein
MGPLGFVNWRALNAHFRTLMWIAAALLAWVILMHLGSPAAGTAHRTMTRAPVHRAGTS